MTGVKPSAACAALPLVLVLGACGSGGTSAATAGQSAGAAATSAPAPAGTATVLPGATTAVGTPAASASGRPAVGATGTVTSRSGAVTITLPPGVAVQDDNDPEHDLAAQGSASRLLVGVTTAETLASLTQQVHTMCQKTVGTRGTVLATDDLVLDGEKGVGCTGQMVQAGKKGYAMMYVTEHAGKRYMVAAMNEVSSTAADRQLHDAVTSLRFN